MTSPRRDGARTGPEAAVPDALADTAATPRLFLTICRGKTRFPRRPVQGDAFLIGSAPECQLRLGGAMPAHHSTIHLVDGEARITAISNAPALRVNGAECRQSPIHAGDQIEIGPFALGVEAPQPAERSAAELVELIEAEQAMIDEFETGRLRGGEALLNAVRRRATELAHVPQEAAPNFLEDLESAVDLLHEFSDEMERRAGRHSQREAGFARAAQRLLEAQQRLIAQIDAIQKRLAAQDEEQPAPLPLRRVA